MQTHPLTTSNPKSASQLLRAAAVSCGLVLAACSTSVPVDSGPEVLDIKPQVGGQSGVAGSCWPGPPWRDIDKDAVRALAQGPHETDLHWNPWWQPSAAADDEHVTIDVTLRDRDTAFTYYPGEDCGYEVVQAADVTLRAHTQSGARNVSFPAAISASEHGNALVFVDFADQALLPRELRRLLPQVKRDANAGTVKLRMGISEHGVNGMITRNEGTHDCRVGRIGGVCGPDDQEVERETSFGELSAAAVVAALEADSMRAVQRYDGSRTNVKLEVRLLDQPLCTHPLGFEEQTQYTGKPAGEIAFGAKATVVIIPVEMRITTEDGVLDVWIPTDVKAMITEAGPWNRRMLFDGRAIVPGSARARIAGAIPGDIADDELLLFEFSGNNVDGDSPGWKQLMVYRIEPDATSPTIDEILDARQVSIDCWNHDDTEQFVERLAWL